MVRRSVLVYDLLRSERSIDGLSEKEIFNRISRKYNIFAGKSLRRQITVALRRGIDFGVVKKRFNKYRFDPDFLGNVVEKRPTPGKGRSSKKRQNTARRSTTRRRSSTKNKRAGKRKIPEPKPKLPAQSPWQQERRDLRKEPIPRFVKHR